MTGGDGVKVVVEAAKANANLIDVDEEDATPIAANTGADVDDQALDGWGELTSNTTTTDALTTKPPQQPYPLIPSKELGENPVNPSTHPHLHSFWQGVYNVASSPNALVADLCNLRLVTKTNLNQTAVQTWWWELGDKLAGYPDDVKVQALTAGLPKAKGKHAKGKKLVLTKHAD